MRCGVGAIVVLAAVSVLPGCGGGPKLVPISGTVTLNGKPFKDAEILFVPDPSNTVGLPGNDRTGPEGNYKAMTEGRSGLVPGKYKVVVSRVTFDTSRIPSEFKDDPVMAQIVLQGPDQRGDLRPPASKTASGTANEIKGEFEREVPTDGGILDFDVKAEVSKG
jgi:hypothetical protein